LPVFMAINVAIAPIANTNTTIANVLIFLFYLFTVYKYIIKI
jgi:hypothetical protein